MWDLNFIGDEPGDDAKAPYQVQHAFASGVEEATAKHLGIDLQEYEKRLKEIMK